MANVAKLAVGLAAGLICASGVIAAEQGHEHGGEHAPAHAAAPAHGEPHPGPQVDGEERFLVGHHVPAYAVDVLAFNGSNGQALRG